MSQSHKWKNIIKFKLIESQPEKNVLLNIFSLKEGLVVKIYVAKSPLNFEYTFMIGSLAIYLSYEVVNAPVTAH